MHFPGKTTLSAAALGAILVFAWGNAQAADGKDKISPSVIQQGWAATPIPKEELNLKGKDQAQVALGSYLTFAGDSVGCHSFPRFLRPGGTPTNMSGEGSDPRYGDPFDPPPLGTPQTVDGQLKANFNKRHYLAGGRCFGAIQARNLTPDDSGLPRGMTEAEFIRAMRTGEDVTCKTKSQRPTYFQQPDNVCDLKPRGLGGYDPEKLQTMPWVTYHNLTDNDLKAIYAYLAALPKATACNTVEDGCAGFNGRAKGLPSGQYAYGRDDKGVIIPPSDPRYDAACPNPPPPQ
jgi:hypothetical protein